MKSTSLFLTHDLAIGNALSGFSFVALQPFSGRIQFALNDSTTFATAVQGAPAVPGPGHSSCWLRPPSRSACAGD